MTCYWERCSFCLHIETSAAPSDEQIDSTLTRLGLSRSPKFYRSCLEMPIERKRCASDDASAQPGYGDVAAAAAPRWAPSLVGGSVALQLIRDHYARHIR